MIRDPVKLRVKIKHPSRRYYGVQSTRHQEVVHTGDPDVMGVEAETTGLRAGKGTEELGG